jgi:ER lumen protein retaining receptor
MVFLADGLDLLCEMIYPGKTSKVYSDQGTQGAIGFCYATFLFGWFVVCALFSNLDFSAILTASSCVQCLGFLILNVKVRGTKSVAGLSSGTLVMFVLHFCTRLTSTTLRNGYLPMDKSGDCMYQCLDATSLVLLVHLLYRMHKTHKDSYQAWHDTMPILPLVIPCIVLACCVHGNFNKNVFFDVVWTTSAYLETVALVPQLWMMASRGGQVDGMTAHFVACVVASGVMNFTFWYWTHTQMERRGPSSAGRLILALQGLRLFLSADFAYYYALAWLGGSGLVVLPEQQFVEP